MSGRRVLVVVASYLAIALMVFPVFPHFVSPNEFSRWLLAASLIEHGTLEVTALAQMFGPRFEDLSEREGRFYSNKAPGAAFLGLPGYAIARIVIGPPSKENLRASVTAMRLFAATFPLIGLAIFMIVLARRIQDQSEGTAFGVFALLFATPLFSYGLLLFAHALTAAAVFVAWALLFAGERKPANDFLAGAAIGFAVLSEYPLAGAGLICLGALAWEKRLGSAARFLAGGVPPALVLAAYNTAAFGGPLRLSSGYERLSEFRTLAATGLFGVGVPSPSAAMQMLLGPRKGLLLLCPILILGIMALPAARRLLSRSAFWSLVAIPSAILLVYSGYPNWHGGWSFGPRYLAAAIPFLIFPLLLTPLRPLACFAAGFSTVATMMASLTFPFPPNAFPLPWATFSPTLLARGLVAPNLFHLTGWPLAVAIPLILCAVALSMAFPRRMLRHAVSGGGLAILIAIAVAHAREAPLSERLQLAYIQDVYFERSVTLEELGIPLPPRLLARRELERQLPPPSWPFR